MNVRKLDTTRPRDVHAFVRFPFRLYESCSQWVPPLLPDMRFALDKGRYPFYRSSDADFFVVESEGEVLGRVAVLENRPYNEFHGSKAAFFYYFESVQDVEAVRRLFDAAFDWARARGLDTVYGPKGLLRADGHGLLVDGFEHRPAMGIPYNYPYYEALVREVGFEKELDYYSGHLTAEYEMPGRIHDIADKVKERRGFWVRSFRRKAQLRQLVPAVHAIYQQAWVQVWGYYPVSQQEIAALIRRIQLIADPRLIKVVMKEEEAIGFVFAYPDISAAIQRTGGRLWPLGWLQLLIEARRTRWVNFNGVGVLPRYQGAGANALLYSELYKTFTNNRFRFEHGDFVQVAENNYHSLGDANVLGISWYKRHRIYRRAL